MNPDSASLVAGSNARRDLGLGAHDAHAAPAAAARRLEDHRKADAPRLFDGVIGIAEDLAAREQRKPEALRVAARGDLVAPRAHRLGRRPDERHAALLAERGELGVLGEEAVARMDCVGAGDLGGADDRRNIQVTRRSGSRADAHRLVGEAHVQRAGVDVGVHGDRRDAELAAGADDAQRDLAAVRDEDLLERGGGFANTLARSAHAFLMRKSFCPNSTDFAVLREDLDDGAGDLGLDLVHQLHRLDDAERLAGPDDRADLDERRRVGRRRAIERADERARHVDHVGRLSLAAGSGPRLPPAAVRPRRSERRRRRGTRPRPLERAVRTIEFDILGFVLELGDVLLGEELEQRAQLVDVDGHIGRGR